MFFMVRYVFHGRQGFPDINSNKILEKLLGMRGSSSLFADCLSSLGLPLA